MTTKNNKEINKTKNEDDDNNNNNNNNNIFLIFNFNNQKNILYETLLKLKLKYKFSVTIVRKDFLVVWWFPTEQM